MLKDIDQALISYPLLERTIVNGHYAVIGEVQLVDKTKVEFDRYSVFISFPSAYPNCFPKAKETSNKIPKVASRHINYDGTLCLAVEPEEKAISKNGIKFKFFLDKILVPHLARETYREITGEYPEGEYAHGNVGIWEYYEILLGKKDRYAIIKELELIINSTWPLRNDKCSCGSEKKFKKCHQPIWLEVMKSGENYTIEKLKQLKNEL